MAYCVAILAEVTVKTMKVATMELSSLREYESNARRHGERNMAIIRSSLSNFGQVEPLVVQRATGIVIGGNGRLSAMRELGWQTAEVVLLDIDDAQMAKLSVALNRSAELSTWDNESLYETLRDLGEGELDDLGFSTHELEALAAWAPGAEDEDKIDDYDGATDTYTIKISGVRADDKDRLLRKVQDCVADEQGVKVVLN